MSYNTDEFDKILFISLREYIFYSIYNVKYKTFHYIIRYNELSNVLFYRDLSLNKSISLSDKEKIIIDYILNIISGKNIHIDKNSLEHYFNIEYEKQIFKDLPITKSLLDWIKNGFYFDYDIDFDFGEYFSLYIYSNNKNIESFFYYQIDRKYENNFYISWYLFLIVNHLPNSNKFLKSRLNYVLSIDKNNPYIYLDYARLIGVHYFTKSNNYLYPELAKKYVSKAIITLGSDTKSYMFSWLGMSYRFLKKYDLALFYVNKGIDLSINEGEISQLSCCWKVSIFYETNNYIECEKLALDYLNSGIITLFDCKLRIYKNIVKVNLKFLNKEKCLFYLLEALELIKKEKGKIIYINTLNNKKSEINFISSISEEDLFNLSNIVYSNIHVIDLEGIEFITKDYISTFYKL